MFFCNDKNIFVNEQTICTKYTNSILLTSKERVAGCVFFNEKSHKNRHERKVGTNLAQTALNHIAPNEPHTRNTLLKFSSEIVEKTLKLIKCKEKSIKLANALILPIASGTTRRTERKMTAMKLKERQIRKKIRAPKAYEVRE